MTKRKWMSVEAFLFIFIFITSTAFAGETSKRYLIRFKSNKSLNKASVFLKDLGLDYQIQIPQLDLYVADAHDIQNFEKVGLAALRASPDVLYVEENAYWHTFNRPNDSKYGSQKGLKDLKAETAWDITTGSYDVVVAVVDSGVDIEHEDLKNQIWTNAGEIPDNGIDDDHNGFIDDVHGWNFVNGTGNPFDDVKHGTHVSGIIGAEGNNGKGVVGVNWKVHIMPVKFIGATGGGATDVAVRAITYAVNNGARVISASWGGPKSSQALSDVISWANQRGVLFIAAAGNDAHDNNSTPSYPTSYNLPGMISVAASDGLGNLASFSNWGAGQVTLAAPGKDILSTTPSSQYENLSGTSMATPMVTGTAALILSQAPNLSLNDLRNALLNATDVQKNYGGKLLTEGDLNASTAISQLQGGFQVWPSHLNLPTGATIQMTAYHANGSVTWSSNLPNVASVDGAGNVTAMSAGTAVISATDSSGAVASAQKITVGGSLGGGSGGGGGGGCGTAKSAGAPGSESTALLGMALPLAVGIVLRRRKK